MELSIDLRILLGLLFCVFSNAQAVTAPQVKTYKKNELQTYLAADFLYATQTFNESGSQQSLNGDHYYLLQMPLGARYSFTDTWAAHVEMQIGYAESKSSDPIY